MSAMIHLATMSSAADAAMRIERGLPYRTAAPDTAMAERCRLDLALPAAGTGFATVLWFHGGGLAQGERELPPALLGQGFAVAGASYRLTPGCRVADCIDDAAAATAWVLAGIAARGGDPSRVVLAGHSAGAYLAAMVTLDRTRLARHGADPRAIAGLALLSGQMITHFAARAEQGIPGTVPIIDGDAPLRHVRADAPPVLLITGDREREMLGRYEENLYFWRMLKVAGHRDAEIREIPGADHGGMAGPALEQVAAWMRNRFQAAR